MAKQSVTIIEIEGVKTAPAFSALSIVQRIDWHHQFELRLPQKNNAIGSRTLHEEASKYVGRKLTVIIRPAGKNTGEEFRFTGLIFGAALSRPHQGNNELVLSGFSPTILLDDGENTRSFSNKNLAGIFAEVMNPYPHNLLNFVNKPQEPEQIPFFVQYKETNWHFLSRLALLYGEWFYYDGSALQLGKPAGQAKALKFGTDLSHFQIGLRMTPPKFGLSVYDYENNQTYETPAPKLTFDVKDEHLSLANNKSLEIFPHQPLHPAKYKTGSKTELEKRAVIEKRERDSQLVYATGSGDYTGLRPGTVIEIVNRADAKSRETYGSYIITAVTHHADVEGHYSHWFEAVPVALASPPPNPNVRPPVCEMQPAIVTDNHDTKNLGRVRVRFFWQKSGEKTPWIRQVSALNGADEGFHFTPETGEQVMVAFEHNNPNRPVVMGGLYHAGAPASHWSDPSNLFKGLQTRGLSQLFFNDTPGKQEVKLNTMGDKNKLVMKQADGQSIVIETGKKMRLEARVKDDGHIEIIAKNITLKAQKDITLETEEGNITIKAAKEFKVESTTSKLKSQAKTEVEGGGELNMEAGVINLN